ncbi:MAG TPA: hypothetical protein VFE53_15900 [Mucilaginibacter sp.]|jgi:hypothetical protein|nr:hypothetical protein [Mucilaginibacter sp.]
MSTLAPHTEQRAIEILAQCLPYFELLANLKMTAEDDFDAKQAENFLLRITKGITYELSDVLTIDSVSFITEDLYVLVQWPWVQELMGYEWFQQDCYLQQAFDDQEYLSSAYFVPVTRVIEINQPG